MNSAIWVIIDGSIGHDITNAKVIGVCKSNIIPVDIKLAAIYSIKRLRVSTAEVVVFIVT